MGVLILIVAVVVLSIGWWLLKQRIKAGMVARAISREKRKE